MKNKAISYSFLLFGFILTGCFSVKNNTVNNSSTQPTQKVREYSVQSVLWQQNAAEYKALCYQAFNIAQLRLDAFLQEENKTGKPLAIITDIDETVLDNSPYNAHLIKIDKEYTVNGWIYWTSMATAKTVPGAHDFLHYAKSKGVEVFYITNRLEREQEATLKNMRLVGFPFADSTHLLLMGDTGSKEDRFNKVRNSHNVLLYLGDNLGDFSSEFRANSTEKRNQLTHSLKAEFGNKFIVLPNPMYGDWETKGIYQGKHDWSDSQKDSIRKSMLHTY